ncbi:MAG: hypothetical protein WAN36_16035 [Calditrichia bacterium]
MFTGPGISRSGVEVEFQPVNLWKSRQPLPLELTISNFSGVPVREVQLCFRTAGRDDFEIQPLQADGFQFRGKLASLSAGGILEYFFRIEYADGREENYPEGAPLAALLKTAVQLPPDFSEEILIISPEAGSQISASEVVVTASFSSLRNKIDPQESRLFLDGREINQFLHRYSDFITYAPRLVTRGSHTVRLELYDHQKDLLAWQEWQFTALRSQRPEREVKNFAVSGRFFSEVRQEQYQNSLWVNDYRYAGGSIKGHLNHLQFGSRFFISNLEAAGRQPVNRYSAFFRYLFWNNRFVEADLGDVYPDLDPFVIQNITLRGFSAQLFLKFVNLQLAWGRHLRAVEGESFIPADTLSGGETVGRYGTFSRTILAVRSSVGSGDNFQAGATVLRAADDTSSIQYGISPAENTVAGLDMMLRLDDRRTVLQGNVGVSAYNRDISGGALPVDSLTEIYPDLSEGEREYYRLAGHFITANPHLLLQPGLAYRAAARFSYLRNNLTVSYQSVDDSYYSLGQPYLLQDNSVLHVSDNLNLLRNQIFLSLGFRSYHDNLQELKTYTTSNRNVFVQIAYFPLGTLPELSVSYNNYRRANDAPADSMNSFTGRAEDSEINSINFSGGFRFRLFDLKQRLGVSLLNYRRTDIHPVAESVSDHLGINLATQFQIPLQTDIQFILQQTRNSDGTPYENSLDMLAFAIDGQYRLQDIFADDQLFLKTRLRWGNHVTEYSGGGWRNDFERNDLSFRINYSLPKLGTLGVLADIISYRGRRDTIPAGSSTVKEDMDYRDYIYSLRYDYNF